MPFASLSPFALSCEPVEQSKGASLSRSCFDKHERHLASRYGFRHGGGFARRFIAGEDIDQALAATRALQATGMLITLDHLGESVTTTEASAILPAALMRGIMLKERGAVLWESLRMPDTSFNALMPGL